MITRENYEAFYLDFLEGTLSKEMEKAFLAFLDANPDLQISDDEFPILEEEEISLTEFDKLLLKKYDGASTPLSHLSPVSINKENVEYFLIAQLEGTIEENQKAELERWLNLHPEYLKDKALYAKTILPQEKVAYLHKSDLYQDAKVIPLWARISSAAASVILLIGIGSYLSLNSVEVGTPDLPQFSEYSSSGKKDNNQTLITDADGKDAKHRVSTKDQFAKNVEFKKDNKVKKGKGKSQPALPTDRFAPTNIANNVVQQKNNDNQKQNENNSVTNENGGILPNQPELATHVTEKNNSEENAKNAAHNDYAFGANPIEPITNELSKRLNTVIDFRRAKESEDNESGFFIKIGKFEFLHKKGGKH